MRFSKLIMGTDLGQSPVLSVSSRKMKKSDEWFFREEQAWNERMNETNMEFQREINAENWEHQQQAWNFQREREGVANQWAIDAEQREDARYWQRLEDERAYNDPAAQMQRLRNAGLNPFLNGDSLGSAGAGSGGPSGAAGASHAGTTSGAGTPSQMIAPEMQGIDFNALASLLVANKQLLQGSMQGFADITQGAAGVFENARMGAAQRDVARAQARKFYSDIGYSTEMTNFQRLENYKAEQLRDSTINTTLEAQRLQNQQIAAQIAKTEAETQGQNLANEFDEKTMPVRGQQLFNDLNRSFYQTQLIKSQIQTEGYNQQLVRSQTELVVKEIEGQLQKNRAMARDNAKADMDAESDYGLEADVDGNYFQRTDSEGAAFFKKTAEVKMQNLVFTLEELKYSGHLTEQQIKEMDDNLAWIGRAAARMGLNLVFGGSYGHHTSGHSPVRIRP